jgi:hypothetical protein
VSAPGVVAGGPRGGQRLFYRLYFRSGPAASQPADTRGERVVDLRRAEAWACASLLEMLYVPMGRSGSHNECYLIYESPTEFEAAAAFAPQLDVGRPGDSATALGPEASFNKGVGLLLYIVGQGAIVDRGLVDECEHRLAAAAQSGQLAAPIRWAAGILAGRLVSEYRYDYATARNYYRQGEQAASAQSVEQMIARWWHADALSLVGNTAGARSCYEAIVKTYGAAQERSHVVQRAKAILAGNRDK